jgi:inositol polyphosphate 5-phosphatase INPP5B/F
VEESKLIQKFNIIENYLKPLIKLSTTEVTFKKVKFNQKINKTILIKNVGKIPFKFCFIPKIDEEEISKPWCQVEPLEGFVDEKEEVEIKFTCRVDSKSSNAFIQKKERMDDILVLKIDNGGDYFISVSGEFIPSFLGNSIDHLCKIGNNSIIQNVVSLEENRFPIPKELISLVEKIKSLDVFYFFKINSTAF